MLFQQVINTQIIEASCVPFFHTKPLKPSTLRTDSTPQFGAALVQVLKNTCAHCIDSMSASLSPDSQRNQGKNRQEALHSIPRPASKQRGLLPPLRILHMPLPSLARTPPSDFLWVSNGYRWRNPQASLGMQECWRRSGHLLICRCWHFC